MSISSSRRMDGVGVVRVPRPAPNEVLQIITNYIGYEYISFLGGGGFGRTYRVRSPDGFEMALKVVPLDEPAGATELRSLNIIRNVRHPNLLPIVRTWQIEGHLAILMELASGTLSDRYMVHRRSGLAGVPAIEATEYMLDAAKGLDYLNANGIQHQDIKPENLLLVGGCVKVADFGLLHFLQHTLSNFSGGMTIAYAPPEYFKGRITKWSDQYQLGVTYCYLRGGRVPFVGNVAELINGHINDLPDLTMLHPSERPSVERALAKVPADRWPNCRTFAEELRRSLPGDGGDTGPGPVPGGPRGGMTTQIVDNPDDQRGDGFIRAT